MTHRPPKRGANVTSTAIRTAAMAHRPPSGGHAQVQAKRYWEDAPKSRRRAPMDSYHGELPGRRKGRGSPPVRGALAPADREGSFGIEDLFTERALMSRIRTPARIPPHPPQACGRRVHSGWIFSAGQGRRLVPRAGVLGKGRPRRGPAAGSSVAGSACRSDVRRVPLAWVGWRSGASPTTTPVWRV